MQVNEYSVMKHAAISIDTPPEYELSSAGAELLIQANAALINAQTEQWEPLVKWAPHWHQALVSLFDSQDSEAAGALDKKTVQQFIEVNERLMALVKNARDSIAEQLKHFTRGRRAVRAYHEDYQ
jgi:hypothetical protein